MAIEQRLVIPYALLANRAYYDDRTEENKPLLPEGWQELARTGPLESGFQAGVYTNGNEVVIAYSGTSGGEIFGNGSDRADWVNNVQLGLGFAGEQLYEAVRLYARVARGDFGTTGLPIRVVGHSLGGGLASLVAGLFGAPATTFAMAPFELALNSNNVQRLAEDLDNLGLEAQAAQLRTLLYTVATDWGETLVEIDREVLAARELLVDHWAIDGEILEILRASFTTFAAPVEQPIDVGETLATGTQLHSMSLHLAALESESFRAASRHLPSLLALVFDRNLYARDLRTSQEVDFLERLIRYQFAYTDPGYSEPTPMLDRFGEDMLRLAFSDGLVAEQAMRDALITIGIEHYYYVEPEEQTSFFTAITGGLHFDLDSIGLPLNEQRGYARLREFVSQQYTSLNPSVFDTRRQWFVQAGVLGMFATSEDDIADVMLGGSGLDALEGGQGDDLLLGGYGNDVYRYRPGDGEDELLDIDGRGIILYNGQPLILGFREATDPPNQYKSKDNATNYIVQDNNLLITFADGGSITIRNFNRASETLSIRLIDLAPDPTVTFEWPAFVYLDDEGKEVAQRNGTNWSDFTGTLDFFDFNNDGSNDLGSILGTDLPEVIHGGSGHDVIDGGGGADRLFGDEDNDVIIVSLQELHVADALAHGGAGRDVVLAPSKGRDHVVGGSNDDPFDEGDLIVSEGGNDRLEGGRGDDLLFDYDGADLLEGGDGDDYLYSSVFVGFVAVVAPPVWGVTPVLQTINGVERIGNTYQFPAPQFTGVGFLNFAPESDNLGDILLGGAGNDFLVGGPGDDYLDAGAGDDNSSNTNALLAGLGNDVLIGGAGRDWLLGDGGDDFLAGGAGDDMLFGDEQLSAGGVAGDDTLDGGEGDDELYGHVGDDVLLGGPGNDTLLGGHENDFLYGEEGDDFLQGGDGTGGDGNDVLFGGDGNDQLVGEEGDDILFGGSGDDILSGGPGADILDGGGGNDWFLLEGENDRVITGGGIDQIDIVVSSGASASGFTIEIAENFADAQLQQFQGSDGRQWLRIWFSDENSLLLQNGLLDHGQTFEIGGEIFTQQQLMTYAPALNIVGTPGDDRIYGSNQDDTLSGGAGNDVLDGQAGSDAMSGGEGDDAYVYERGDGLDLVSEIDGIDSVLFGDGILAEDIGLRITRSDTFDLVLQLDNEDKLILRDWYNPTGRVEYVQFADGTLWDAEYLESRVRLITAPTENVDLDGTDTRYDVFLGPTTTDGFELSIVDAGGNDIIRFNSILLGDGPFGAIYWRPALENLVSDGADLLLHVRLEGVGTPVRGTVRLVDFFGNGQVERIQVDDARELVVPEAVGVLPGIYVRTSASEPFYERFDVNDFYVGISSVVYTGTETDEVLSPADELAGHGATYYGNGGNDLLIGGTGNDTLVGGSGADRMEGGRGSDTYYIDPADSDTIFDSSLGDSSFPRDTLRVSSGIGLPMLTFAREGNDLLIGATRLERYFERGSEGTSYPYMIERLEGDDFVIDDLGAYLASLGLMGSYVGTEGPDDLYGDEYPNTLHGGGGDDTLRGGLGDDEIWGEDGDDQLYGEGTYEGFARTYNDRLDGGAGNDYLQGDEGSDTLFGAVGNDVLYGDYGFSEFPEWMDEWIHIDHGRDTLIGGPGDDVLYGEQDGDTYVFGQGDGVDVIQDWGYDRWNVDWHIDGNTIIEIDREIVRLALFQGDTFQSDIGHYLPDELNYEYIWPSSLTVAVDELFEGVAPEIALATLTELRNWLVQDQLDVVAFGEGITPEALTVEVLPGELGIDIGGGDLLLIRDPDGGSNYGIEIFRFADGRELTLDEMMALDPSIDHDMEIVGNLAANVLVGGNGNDYLNGRGGADVLIGGAGDDVLEGGWEESTEFVDRAYDADVLDGGRGNDRMLGYDGPDTYIIRLGDGVDFIEDSGNDPDTRLIDSYIDEVTAFSGSTYSDGGYWANVILGEYGMFPVPQELARAVGALEHGVAPEVALQTLLDLRKWLVAQQADVVEFGEGITTESITIKWTESEWTESGVFLVGTGADEGALIFGIELFRFADGRELTAEEMRSLGEYVPYRIGDIGGTEGDDVLVGDFIDDFIWGESGDDLLTGGSGDDTLIGNDGNDIIVGGISRWGDWANGEAGSDVYLFNRQDITGDSILDFHWDSGAPNIGVDTISLGADIRPENIDAFIHIDEESGDSGISRFVQLWLVLHGTQQSIVVDWSNYYVDNEDETSIFDSYAIERIQFIGYGDYRVFDLAGLVEARFAELAEASEESPIPLFTPDALANFDITDQVQIAGGQYAINYALTGDVFTAPGDNEPPVLGDGGSNVLTGTEGNDSLYGLGGHDVIDGKGGNDLIVGGTGAETLVGGAGDDTLIGGTGNDSLQGGGGDDTYVFNPGDGQERITDTGGMDKVLLGADPLSIVFARNGDDLQLRLLGGADTLTVTGWYNDAALQTEVVTAQSGAALLNSQVDQLIQAMNQFLSENGGITWEQAIAERPQEVESVLAAYWQQQAA